MQDKRNVLKSSRVIEMKQKKRKRVRLKIAIVILSLAALIIGLSYLSKIKAMRIDRVVISGNSVVDTDDLLHKVQSDIFGNYFYLFSKQNSMIYPKKAIEEHLLDTFKRLKTVRLDLSDLHTLQVSVTERDGKYLWCGHQFEETLGESSSTECYYIDVNGYIFSKAPYFSGDVFMKFYGTGLFNNSVSPVGQQFLELDQFQKFLSFRDKISALGLKVYALVLNPNGEYNLYIAPLSSERQIHTKIVFSKKNDFDKIIDNLAVAIATEPFATDFKKKFDTLQYIDLRFTNKVYYKFAKAGTTQASTVVPPENTMPQF